MSTPHSVRIARLDLPLVRVRQKDPEVLGLVEPKQLVRGFVLRMIFWVEGARIQETIRDPRVHRMVSPRYNGPDQPRRATLHLEQGGARSARRPLHPEVG